MKLWLRWVDANSLAKLIGLGLTFALDILIICLAWALGMPVIFASVDRAYVAYESGSVAGALLIFAAALALTGAVVGAVHGLALVRLAGNQTTAPEEGRLL